jgi:hypothetical protein
MDIEGIVFIILGILSIAVGIFGKFRPDIVYREWNEKGGFRQFGFSTFRLGGKELAPEVRQRFGFVTFILLGIMFIMLGIAISISQWQPYNGAIAFSIVMLMTVVLLLMYWKIVLSQDEKSRIGLVIVLLLSAALLVLTAYYWRLTLMS